jgi:hypothetical protein
MAKVIIPRDLYKRPHNLQLDSEEHCDVARPCLLWVSCRLGIYVLAADPLARLARFF